MTQRSRLDKELVRRNLVTSAEEAAEVIAAKRVLVNGSVAMTSTRMISNGESLHVEDPPNKYVGRGGKKLEAALTTFGVDPSGQRVIDVGASTGGFTDALLQAGAASVVAVDVGRGQLHDRLAKDPRVTNLERTDVRSLDGDFEGKFDLLTADLSFISLRVVIERLVELVRPGADLIVLLKPQFEATKLEADAARGVISDPEIWRRTVLDAISTIERSGAATMGAMVSPIRGAEGNVEFLLWLRRGGSGEAIEVDALITSATIQVGQ